MRRNEGKIKILTISAHYPPYHSGGYGIRIKNIMDGLVEMGHEILVLSTRAKQAGLVPEDCPNYLVERVLHNHYGIKSFLKELYFDILDVWILRRYIKDFNPDLIYLGHIYPITKQLMPLLSSLPIQIFFDEGGNGLKGTWTDHGRWFKLLTDFRVNQEFFNKLMPFFKNFALWISKGKLINTWAWPENMAIMFNSNLNLNNARRFGVPVQNAGVVHSGLDVEKFTFRPRSTLSVPIRIIIPGRIEQKKGQIDGVRLINELSRHGIAADLILPGSCSDVNYAKQIQEQVTSSSLESIVVFQNLVSQEDMVRLYHQSDICFFSSYHQSGFSRVPLEAMACGSIVISYGYEGSDEIIKNGATGYLVAPGDIEKIVEIIKDLNSEPVKVEEICLNARRDITENYALKAYIDKIEEYLRTSISKAQN